jgi:hypothetical protein
MGPIGMGGGANSAEDDAANAINSDGPAALAPPPAQPRAGSSDRRGVRRRGRWKYWRGRGGGKGQGEGRSMERGTLGGDEDEAADAIRGP